MRLQEREIHAIAIALADQEQKAIDLKNKEIANDPKHAIKSAELYKKLEALPAELKAMLNMAYRETVTPKRIKEVLINKHKLQKGTNTNQLENKVRLAAMECDTLAQLKKKLKIDF